MTVIFTSKHFCCGSHTHALQLSFVHSGHHISIRSFVARSFCSWKDNSSYDARSCCCHRNRNGVSSHSFSSPCSLFAPSIEWWPTGRPRSRQEQQLSRSSSSWPSSWDHCSASSHHRLLSQEKASPHTSHFPWTKCIAKQLTVLQRGTEIRGWKSLWHGNATSTALAWNSISILSGAIAVEAKAGSANFKLGQ